MKIEGLDESDRRTRSEDFNAMNGFLSQCLNMARLYQVETPVVLTGPLELVVPNIGATLCNALIISPSIHCLTSEQKVVYQCLKSSTVKPPNPTCGVAGASKIAFLELVQFQEILQNDILV